MSRAAPKRTLQWVRLLAERLMFTIRMADRVEFVFWFKLLIESATITTYAEGIFVIWMISNLFYQAEKTSVTTQWADNYSSPPLQVVHTDTRAAVHSVRFFAQWHQRHLCQAKFELLSVSLSVLFSHAWLHIFFHFVFLQHEAPARSTKAVKRWSEVGIMSGRKKAKGC